MKNSQFNKLNELLKSPMMKNFMSRSPKMKILIALVALGALWTGATLTPEKEAATARDYGQQKYEGQNKYRDQNKYRNQDSAYNRKTNNYSQRNVAGQFDYYDLVLSWSPTYCETGGDQKRDPQCTSSRPYSFILHGVWPQYEKGWPQSCPTKKNSWVSRELIQSMMDIMPSKGLIIHEYKKHGTCSGLSPEQYYDLSRKLYNSIKIPPRYKAPEKPLLLSPKEIENDFLVNNPDLKPEMISIVCGKRRLREIRICYNKSGKLRGCGQNENQSRLCRLPKVYLPPVRNGRS